MIVARAKRIENQAYAIRGPVLIYKGKSDTVRHAKTVERRDRYCTHRERGSTHTYMHTTHYHLSGAALVRGGDAVLSAVLAHGSHTVRIYAIPPIPSHAHTALLHAHCTLSCSMLTFACAPIGAQGILQSYSTHTSSYLHLLQRKCVTMHIHNGSMSRYLSNQ